MRAAGCLALLAAALLAACASTGAGRSGTWTASWYGDPFHGRLTASGERFNKNELTAAHKTLPFGTRLRVSDPATGRSVIVRINDRGPFVAGRDLDLSQAAAERLGMIQAGVARVRVQRL